MENSKSGQENKMAIKPKSVEVEEPKVEEPKEIRTSEGIICSVNHG